MALLVALDHLALHLGHTSPGRTSHAHGLPGLARERVRPSCPRTTTLKCSSLYEEYLKRREESGVDRANAGPAAPPETLAAWASAKSSGVDRADAGRAPASEPVPASAPLSAAEPEEEAGFLSAAKAAMSSAAAYVGQAGDATTVTGGDRGGLAGSTPVSVPDVLAKLGALRQRLAQLLEETDLAQVVAEGARAVGERAAGENVGERPLVAAAVTDTPERAIGSSVRHCPRAKLRVAKVTNAEGFTAF